MNKISIAVQILLLITCVSTFAYGFNTATTARLLLSSGADLSSIAEAHSLLEISQRMFVAATTTGILFIALYIFELLKRSK